MMQSIRACGRYASLHYSFSRVLKRNSLLTMTKMTYSDKKQAADLDQSLAKPGKIRNKHPAKSPSNQPGDENKIDTEVMDAVDSVAKSLGDKGHRVKSDLLLKLRQHAEVSEDLKNNDTTNVSVLLANMKVESSNRIDKARTIDAENGIGGQQSRRRGIRSMGATRPEFSKTSESHPDRREAASMPDIRLFEGPAAGIFKNKASGTVALSTSRLFNDLEKEEIEALSSVPPVNAFEEQIQWTKEGKIWTFPVDNDQGLTEEAKVGFHEHIFLEPLLNNFPKKGPVRHFMELVAVGLSKNPYLTVQEKKNHIQWFEEYFKDKYHYFEDPATVAFCNQA